MTVIRLQDARKPTLAPEVREFVRALAVATAGRDHRAEMAAKAATKRASEVKDE